MAATYIKSEPSTNGTKQPNDAGSLIRSSEWGIDNTLTDVIIQNETIAKEAITDTTQDQKGAVVSQLDYDYHWTLNLDVIGSVSADVVADTQVGDYLFYYNGYTWKVNSITYTGTYNDKKKWHITAERWVNFPVSG